MGGSEAAGTVETSMPGVGEGDGTLATGGVAGDGLCTDKSKTPPRKAVTARVATAREGSGYKGFLKGEQRMRVRGNDA